MADTYTFRCNAAEHTVTVADFDLKVLARAQRYVMPSWRVGIFGLVRAGDRLNKPYQTALEDAGLIQQSLEESGELLHFVYGLELTLAGEAGVKTITDFGFSLNGGRAHATASAGMAAVERCNGILMDASTADDWVATGSMRPDEAELFHRHEARVFTYEKIRDLRDLCPFYTDEGHKIQAIRAKARRTKILLVVREIVRFLEAHPCDSVELSGVPQVREPN